MPKQLSLRSRTSRRFRTLLIEPLENRVYLSGTPVADAIPWGTPPSTLAAEVSSLSMTTSEPGTVLSAASGDFSRAVESINRFAFDLYRNFQTEQGNLFISPLSIATALAMTYAGARGETASQMADVFHFGTEPGIHDSFRTLLQSLNPTDSTRSFELDVANALWPQQDYPFRQQFLQLVESQYGGASQGLDYRNNAEGAREIINAWVEQQTHDRIKDLIPEGAIDGLTRLVLTNAIYFKGQWAEKFDPAFTQDRPFYLESGEAVDVPMMYLNS